MSQKKIYVISDLHMGDGGPRDNFGYARSDKPRQFSEFLDFVASQSGELMILGDLFEFWQSPLAEVIMSNIKLLDKMADMEVDYIIGNHDADLNAFRGQDMLTHPFFKEMSGPIVREIAGRQFKFQHGHEVDPFNSADDPGWGTILAIFAGIFEEKNGSPMLEDGVTVEEALEKFGEAVLVVWSWLVRKLTRKLKDSPIPRPKEELTPAQNPGRIAGLIEKYRENRDKEGYDVAIVGHTHQAGKLKNEDWYFNSGTWSRQENEFLTISADGRVQFYRWKDGGAIPWNPVIEI